MWMSATWRRILYSSVGACFQVDFSSGLHTNYSTAHARSMQSIQPA